MEGWKDGRVDGGDGFNGSRCAVMCKRACIGVGIGKVRVRTETE